MRSGPSPAKRESEARRRSPSASNSIRQPAWALVGPIALWLAFAQGAARAAELVVPPSVQDVSEQGLVVAYETDVEAEGAVELDGQTVRTRGRRHEARFTGLAVGARHVYRVLIDGRPRTQGEVATAPARDVARFSFAVYGDTRDGDTMEEAVARAIVGESPDLVLHTGDLVRAGDDDEAWRQFFTREELLTARVPVYPTLGNHEILDDPDGERFRRYFVLPGEPRPAPRAYYTFRFASARFVVLDANAVSPEQTAWLRATLEAGAREAGVRHLFVLLHEPPLSVGGHCGAAVEEAGWVELFERHRVRAVFGGHDHAYERLERGGVRYFISGGGGAAVYPERPDCAAYDRAARRVYLARHHYLRVLVDGDRIQVTAQPVAGAPGEPPLDEVAFSPATPLYAEAPALVDERFGGAWRRAWLVAAVLAVYLVARRYRRL
jgi:hypothetical protein